MYKESGVYDGFDNQTTVITDLDKLQAITNTSTLPEQFMEEAEEYTIIQSADKSCNQPRSNTIHTVEDDAINANQDAYIMPVLVLFFTSFFEFIRRLF